MAVLPGSVYGQQACLPRHAVIAQLGDNYSESVIAIGLSNGGGVIEVLTSPKGETFTIIVTMPNGRSCLIAAGEGWETVPAMPRVEPRKGRGT